MVDLALKQQLLALPSEDRFTLMRELQDSLFSEGHRFDPTWLREELDRRAAEDQAHPDQAVSIDTMRQYLSDRHGWGANG